MMREPENQHQYSPLELHEGNRRLQPNLIERTCTLFPVIGWVLGSYLSDRREAQLRLEIANQLQVREKFPSNRWSRLAPDIPPLAVTRYCKAIMTACEWPNSHFLPDDPVRYVVIGSEILEIASEVFEYQYSSYRKFRDKTDIPAVYRSDLLFLFRCLLACECRFE